MFTIKINTGNEAFDQPSIEIARILRKLAKDVDLGIFEGKIFDINGNTVGSFKYTNK